LLPKHQRRSQAREERGRGSKSIMWFHQESGWGVGKFFAKHLSLSFSLREKISEWHQFSKPSPVKTRWKRFSDYRPRIPRESSHRLTRASDHARERSTWARADFSIKRVPRPPLSSALAVNVAQPLACIGINDTPANSLPHWRDARDWRPPRPVRDAARRAACMQNSKPSLPPFLSSRAQQDLLVSIYIPRVRDLANARTDAADATRSPNVFAARSSARIHYIVRAAQACFRVSTCCALALIEI